MRMQQKQINYLLLFSLFMLIFLPVQVLAKDNEQVTGKGKMQIKTDRILQNKDENETVETELDKVFPGLFKDETKEKIETHQLDMESTTNNVREIIFEEPLQASVTLEELKANVFQDSYEPPKAYTLEEMDEASNSTVSSIVFYGSITMVVGVIFGGVYMLLRKWGM
ncbi:type VII secretion protein EssA [Pseudogracilibacillus auburnensis]|uniref:type VII secretion protein EssA n=1 Tax=Pseudogracilibacillus auburnensis TaxID=1494959 RepID=UPI001A95B69F|nr:type VII secretion protein EssA [Pseudogracilibacillus auburnensis]MBO1002408.1 type VII secretion protein EssA [Pseudogracilibacillus auburnensis]